MKVSCGARPDCSPLSGALCIGDMCLGWSCVVLFNDKTRLVPLFVKQTECIHSCMLCVVCGQEGGGLPPRREVTQRLLMGMVCTLQYMHSHISASCSVHTPLVSRHRASPTSLALCAVACLRV